VKKLISAGPFDLAKYKETGLAVTRVGGAARLVSEKGGDGSQQLLWVITADESFEYVVSTSIVGRYYIDEEVDDDNDILLAEWVTVYDFKPLNVLSQVAEFHKAFGHGIADRPCVIDEDRAALRIRLIEEELNELKEAIASHDIVGIADALCDLQYVLAGTILEYGLGEQFEKLFNAVHTSNMSKAFGSYEEAVEFADTRADVRMPTMSPSSYVPGIRTYDDGKTYVVVDKGGKTLKPPHYTPANLGDILEL
jgi:hypothetical protein